MPFCAMGKVLRLFSIIADRHRLRSDINDLLITLSRRDTSSIHLIYFGLGLALARLILFFILQTKQSN
jgi:hypothetical protein